MFRPISHIQGLHVKQMLMEEVALFTGSETCHNMYRHSHIQAEDLPEESLHFITAQSVLTTLAIKYPKTPSLAHLNMYFNIVFIKEMMLIFYSW
jgi:hypothetical protein